MVAFTTNKGIPQPTVSGDKNQWGTFLNQGMAIIDLAFGGSATVAVGGSVNVTATASDAQNLVQVLTGTLTGDISYLLPATGGMFVVDNATAGTFTATVKTVAGGSTGFAVPQGEAYLVISDGTNVRPAVGTATGGLILKDALTVKSGGITVTAGGVNINAGGVTVGAGGANITGDVAVTGSLSATKALTISSGGAKVTGDVAITGTLSATKALTVSSGGMNVTGDSALTGALTISTSGTTTTQAVNYSQFGQSNANPGYVTLPGGYRRAFGQTSVTLAGNVATVSYGITFAQARAVVCWNGNGAISPHYCVSLGKTTSQFQVYVPDQASGAYVVEWMAEGWV